MHFKVPAVEKTNMHEGRKTKQKKTKKDKKVYEPTP
jgi:hypothetical protein